MAVRIVLDGLNLSLAEGTGIATYTRILTQVARELGHEVGVVYGSPQAPPKDGLLREVTFFDEKRAIKSSAAANLVTYITDQVRYRLPVKPRPVDLSGAVVTRQFATRLPTLDQIFVAR